MAKLPTRSHLLQQLQLKETYPAAEPTMSSASPRRLISDRTMSPCSWNVVIVAAIPCTTSESSNFQTYVSKFQLQMEEQ